MLKKSRGIVKGMTACNSPDKQGNVSPEKANISDMDVHPESYALELFTKFGSVSH